MTDITLAYMQDIKLATQRINARIAEVARDIYAIRYCEPLPAAHGFESYSDETFVGMDFAGQSGPDWGVGTPIFSVSFYWGRTMDYLHVTFPQAWIEMDWKALEIARLDLERAELAAARSANDEATARRREEAEYETYKKLRAKYEGIDPDD